MIKKLIWSLRPGTTRQGAQRARRAARRSKIIAERLFVNWNVNCTKESTPKIWPLEESI
ncbi:MAG TPA: hypothetical protein VIM48_02110 [Chthoniobacterales bacterium]